MNYDQAVKAGIFNFDFGKGLQHAKVLKDSLKNHYTVVAMAPHKTGPFSGFGSSFTGTKVLKSKFEQKAIPLTFAEFVLIRKENFNLVKEFSFKNINNPSTSRILRFQEKIAKSTLKQMWQELEDFDLEKIRVESYSLMLYTRYNEELKEVTMLGDSWESNSRAIVAKFAEIVAEMAQWLINNGGSDRDPFRAKAIKSLYEDFFYGAQKLSQSFKAWENAQDDYMATCNAF